MRGLPAGMRIEVPSGWESAAFFEKAAVVLGPGTLSEKIPLDREGRRYAAKLSPGEVFDCLRYIDIREYCRLKAAEQAKKEKTGVEDFDAFYQREMRHRRGGN